MGPGFFSFIHFGDYFLPEIYGINFFLPKLLTKVIEILSLSVFVPFIYGVIKGIRDLRDKMKGNTIWTPKDLFLFCALITVFTYIVFFSATRIPHHPHYFNGIWFPYFFLIWTGIDSAIKKGSRWMSTLLTTQITTMLTMLILVIGFIHLNGGNRGIHYGPTLANQMDIVRTVLKYPPTSPIHNAVPNYRYFPHAFYTLIKLLRSDSYDLEKAAHHIYLFHGSDPNQGWIYINISNQPIQNSFEGKLE